MGECIKRDFQTKKGLGKPHKPVLIPVSSNVSLTAASPGKQQTNTKSFGYLLNFITAIAYWLNSAKSSTFSCIYCFNFQIKHKKIPESRGNLGKKTLDAEVF